MVLLIIDTTLRDYFLQIYIKSSRKENLFQCFSKIISYVSKISKINDYQGYHSSIIDDHSTPRSATIDYLVL